MALVTHVGETSKKRNLAAGCRIEKSLAKALVFLLVSKLFSRLNFPKVFSKYFFVENIYKSPSASAKILLVSDFKLNFEHLVRSVVVTARQF